MKPVVIVGAGIGGLSAAIRLAAVGHKVLVLEQNATIGGKMGEVREAGFRWDTGPSVITMRHVLVDLFASAGKRLEDYLTLEPLEPITRYFYPDGTVLDCSRDLPTMLGQIQALDERDVEGYLNYLAYAARLHRITGPVFIYDQPPTLASFSRVAPRDMLRVDPFRTMQSAINGFVQSPHLRQLLGRFATYVGASPYLAPATLNVIAHVELNEGVWYPRGGIYRIARALEKLAVELGVEIRTGCAVHQIVVEGKQVTDVLLTDGTRIATAGVIANVDVATVYEKLLPEEFVAGQLKELTQQESSCSGFILLLGIEGQHPHLAHHNIFFSGDYPREFKQIFEDGLPPDDPTIYVSITSKTDEGDAPQGSENWFVLVNAPPLSSRFAWSAQATAYRDRLLDKLALHGVEVRGSIRTERMFTPVDLERLTGARRGALYGWSSNNRLAAFRRPHNRAAGVRGLYFAGGTTHPGGGVPMVMLSGKVAVELMLKEGIRT